MLKLLLVRPGRPDDDAERTAYLFADEIVLQIECGDSECSVVQDVSGPDAVRAGVEHALQSCDPDGSTVFAFYGHGTSGELRGHDGTAAVDEQNAYLLSGWHVYAMACGSLEKLGPAAVSAGAASYLGYKGLVIFAHPDPERGIPSGFRECANSGLAYAVGAGAYVPRKVLKKAIRAYDHWVEHYASIMAASYAVVVGQELEVSIVDTELEGSATAWWALALLEHNRVRLDCAR